MIVTDDRPNSTNSRVLMFSHRNIFDHDVWRCPLQEFQKIIQEVDSVDVLEPRRKSWYVTGKSAALKLGKSVPLPINPGVSEVKVEKEYDMFFTIADIPRDLLHLKAVKGWKDRCKVSVCWLVEFYVHEMALYKSCLEVLKEFDHVVFMFNTNGPFQKVIQGRGQYLPAGVDTLRFCPYPNPPVRSIDVLSIGRRAPITHQALMRMAEEEGKFYVHDTINSLAAQNLDEHRAMFANLAKRSRYFIVSPGKFDSPSETGGQAEFGYRYFEAAAPGTIMIGMRTNNPEFDKIFNWEDVVVEVPFTSDEIVSVIHELDKQPERQQKIRHTNMLQCLLHHDWAYRWESVLKIAGMQPLPMMENRKMRLSVRAEQVSGVLV